MKFKRLQKWLKPYIIGGIAGALFPFVVRYVLTIIPLWRIFEGGRRTGMVFTLPYFGMWLAEFSGATPHPLLFLIIFIPLLIPYVIIGMLIGFGIGTLPTPRSKWLSVLTLMLLIVLTAIIMLGKYKGDPMFRKYPPALKNTEARVQS